MYSLHNSENVVNCEFLELFQSGVLCINCFFAIDDACMEFIVILCCKSVSNVLYESIKNVVRSYSIIIRHK